MGRSATVSSRAGRNTDGGVRCHSKQRTPCAGPAASIPGTSTVAALDALGAARCERASRRLRIDACGDAGHRHDLARANVIGHRFDQPARVGMARARQHLISRRLLDHAPGVHDGDAVGDLADHAEVVRDVDHRDAARLLQPRDLLEDRRLRDHVEAGGRLVEDDERRLADERGGDRDALRLPTRELMHEAAPELLRGGQADALEDLRGLALAVGLREVRAQHLAHPVADADRRVDRRGGLLRHVRRETPAHVAHRMLGEPEDVVAADRDGARGDMSARAREAERGKRRRRLAAARTRRRCRAPRRARP